VKSWTDSLETTWDDDRISHYHFLWAARQLPVLPSAVHLGTREQIVELVDAPDDLAAKSVSLDAPVR